MLPKPSFVTAGLLAALCACAAPNPPRTNVAWQDAAQGPGEATPAAQEPAEPTADEAGAPVATAPQVDPPATEYDWVRLTSGEWLKGELLVLRDGDFEFDSDELDTLKLDWDDVAELRSPRVHTILLEGREKLVGRLSVEGDQVVLTDGEEHRIARDQLLAIVPGEPNEWNYWSGRISLGLTTRKGNTNQSDASAFFEAKRETAATRWSTTYNGAMAKVEGVQTANNHRVDSRFDWFLSDRMFLTPTSIQYFRDPFQNIRLRLTPAAGVGYDVVKTGPMDLSLFVGPAYQYVEYESSEPGTDSSDGTAAGLAILAYSWDVTPDVELGLDYNVTVPLPESNSYNSRLSAVIEVDLIWDFDLEVRFVWDRVNDPKADDTGEVPQKDDFRTTVGLGWEF
jgi:putative salt-induced outer membrane protein YdiY